MLCDRHSDHGAGTTAGACHVTPSPTTARLSDAAFGWLSAFLVGVMLLEWTPGVHAHSVLPAVAVATVGLVLEPLAKRVAGSKDEERAE
ncbi:hypothetical protein SAMN04487983_101821 [Streptomyces sp. yr375]|nr:hypothetical protein SAMN04487983_101821 [Streptomyces sp. yr375]